MDTWKNIFPTSEGQNRRPPKNPLGSDGLYHPSEGEHTDHRFFRSVSALSMDRPRCTVFENWIGPPSPKRDGDDPALVPFLAERQDARAEILLAALFDDLLIEVVRKSVRARLDVRFDQQQQQWVGNESSGAEQVEGGAYISLLRVLRAHRAIRWGGMGTDVSDLSAPSRPIRSLRAAAINAVDFAFSEFLRDKYRNRYLFEERLKHLLQAVRDRCGNPVFAVWLGEGEAGEAVDSRQPHSGLPYLQRRLATPATSHYGLHFWWGDPEIAPCSGPGLDELHRQPSHIIDRGARAQSDIPLKERKQCPPEPRTVVALFLGLRATLPFPELSRALRTHYVVRDDVASQETESSVGEGGGASERLPWEASTASPGADDMGRYCEIVGTWEEVWEAVGQALRPTERLVFLLSEDHLLYILLAGISPQRVGALLTASASFLGLLGPEERIDLTDLSKERPLDCALRRALLPARGEHGSVPPSAIPIGDVSQLLSAFLEECGQPVRQGGLDLQGLDPALPEERWVLAALEEASCGDISGGGEQTTPPRPWNTARVNQVVTLLARQCGLLAETSRLDISDLDETRSPDAEMKRAMERVWQVQVSAEAPGLSQEEIARALNLRDASRIRDALFQSRRKIRAFCQRDVR